MKRVYRYFFPVAAALFFVGGVLAQDTTNTQSVPSSYQLSGLTFEYQGWNNCGPATLTNALTYFGYADDQNRAAAWLKPNNEDKNVSPWQMVEFVNEHVPELPIQAIKRYGGTLDLLKVLISNHFPVIIEAGYDPPPHDLGWMGHYLLVIGYDDVQGVLVTHDSYDGPNLKYEYDYIDGFWVDFNRTYIVLYETIRETELMILLGSDADPTQNALNALEKARQEAVANPTDPFIWFNIGSSYVELAPVYQQQAYEYAVTAYDEARKHGLPWRMMWYQFGPFEAYNAVGRYNDTIALANANLNDGGGQWVEETFYYAGVARENLGDTERALDNYRQAAFLNPNFRPAVEARDRLQAALQTG
jgi:tetratricopeptide (TPR) repeat protein